MASKLDGTEVRVTFMVTTTYVMTTTANAVRAELEAAGADVVEPSDLDDDHDATELVDALLTGNDCIERDAWLTGLAANGHAEIDDESVSIEEVNDV